MLEAAITYAARGWPVLPVQAGLKRPATQHGVKDATTDEGQIRAWWDLWPTANVGIETGVGSGLLVLDVDPRNGGDESLDDICPPAKLPDTWTVRTGGGGRHLYFRYPSDGRRIKNATNMRPGLDLKSSGGYVIAPPSRLDGGGDYVLESEPDAEILDMPEWLAGLLRAGKGDASNILLPTSEVFDTYQSEAIGTGERNVRLTRLAGFMRADGAGAESILEALRAQNRRCRPPLPDEDLARIANSVSKYEPSPDSAPYTDSGNAERLVKAFGDAIRYVPDWNRWILWDGVRWRPDRSNQIVGLALETVRMMYAVAATIDTKTERQAAIAHARASESKRALQAMVDLAGVMTPVMLEELDTDPMLLGVQNGVVDLATGSIVAPDQEQRITKQAAVMYDARADCPRFDRFLGEIFEGDESLIWFVQKAAGYSLTGLTDEQVLFICYGTGSNGKSTLLGVLDRLLGDYSIATPTSTITQNKYGGGIPNDLARLRGARFTTLLEFEEGRRINESIVKALSGGDTIAARFLHGEYFDLHMQAKIWLGTNHKPRILGADHGIWRRIRLLPFTVQIDDDRRDKDLPRVLDAEASGILNWALEGLKMYQAEGLEPPAAVVMATSQFRDESDVLGEFLEQCLDEDGQWETRSSDLYDSYKAYCERSGERAMSQRWLSLRLEERGYLRRKTMSGRVWCGVALKEI